MEEILRAPQQQGVRAPREGHSHIADAGNRIRTRSAMPGDTDLSRPSAHPRRSKSVPRRRFAGAGLQHKLDDGFSNIAEEHSEIECHGVEDIEDEREQLVSTSEESATSAAPAQDSSSSSGSGSTITQASFVQNSGRLSPRRSEYITGTERRPDALSFLDPDSPAVTEETIHRSVTEATTWRRPRARTSPSSRSISSTTSTSSSLRSDESSADHDSSPGTSPEQSEDGDSCSPVPKIGSSIPGTIPSAGRHDATEQQSAYRYGTPEMPRGSTNLPHFRPNVLTPRAPNQGHAKHLPRAEKLPLTGYELLASRISSQPPRPTSPASSTFSSTAYTRRRGSTSSIGARSNRDDGPVLKPIYRRFEALNHRLLLHLQDELSELEEQLRRLDTADTQTRRLQNRILPASRRAEYLAGGELQWHKTDILGKVGYKLGQYNHVLSTFTETSRLAAPSPADVDAYRTYLATQQPIAEIETRFLDPVDDLIALAGPPRQYNQPYYPPQQHEFTHPTAASIRAEYLQSLDDDPAMLTPVPAPRGGGNPYLQNRQQHDYLRRPGSASSSFAASSSVTDSRPVTSQGEAEQPSQSKLAAHSPSPTAAVSKPLTDMPHLAVSAAVAVLLPILMFAVIPGFVGRMAVVLLVAVGVSQMQMASVEGSNTHVDTMTETGKEGGRQGLEVKIDSGLGSREKMMCIGVYGAIMTLVAGLLA